MSIHRFYISIIIEIVSNGIFLFKVPDGLDAYLKSIAGQGFMMKRRSDMTSKILLVLMLAMFTAACFHKPHPHGCPPGQAKKGNCIVIDRD